MSDAKIRAIVKRPDEKYCHVANISNTLKNLQRTVEGPIETVSIGKALLRGSLFVGGCPFSFA